MIRFGWTCSLVVVASLPVRADDAPRPLAVKQLAQDLGTATLKGDYAKVVDHTQATVVQLMGGREKAIKAIEAMMKQLKDQGFALKTYSVGEPGAFLTEGDNTFVIIPTRMEMTFPGGKMIAKSFLLGISPDKGKTWKFADGNGIMKHKEQLDKLLPKLPADLKWPEQEKPEIIKDE